MFGHCLLQVIHQIVDLIFRNPQVKIFIRKEDLKSSYRRMHLQENSALQSSVHVKINEIWYILLLLRLLFGGTYFPS